MRVLGMVQELPVEKLRQYLRELKPEARALLTAELERELLRGEEPPGAELVLQELRRSARDGGRVSPRSGSLARLFYRPLEPFLVDDVAIHKNPGRIARVALDPFWEWICRDLLPGEAKAVSEDVLRAFAADDVGRAEHLARGFQDRVAQRMQDMLMPAVGDEKTQRRLAVQIGTARAIDDARAILVVLKNRDTLATIGARLPGHIKNFSDPLLGEVKTFLDSAHIVPPALFLHGLLIVMSRLATPWQLIRIATKAAGSDTVARVRENRYAVAVDIVLTEIERMVGELKSELRSGRGVAVGALLKIIHDAVRGVRTEIDLSGDSPWGRQLAHIRSDISDLLKSEIESMPGRVRRLLRSRPQEEIRPGSMLDISDVSETETLVEFVMACRNYARELAVSEITQRASSELQQYLEANNPMLIENLRRAANAERPFAQSQFDAAVRFSAKTFGKDYAASLARAGGTILKGEPKAAKA